MITKTRHGRPKAMQSKPVFMDAVFDDPGAAMRNIREKAPYPTLPAHYNVQGASEYDRHAFFRDALTDDFFLHNPRWIAAAIEAFGAAIVHPVRCLINLSAPMEEMGAHIDLPSFRGFVPGTETKDLLTAMMHSGLFYDWMVPFASGLTWFYRGEGGEFLYWADGTSAPPHVLKPPFCNSGLMSDNEAMFHAVGAVGSAEGRNRFTGLLRRTYLLHAASDDAWEIRDGERCVAALDPADLRISLLWKARVFRDEAHMASFDDKRFDLTPELIAEVFLDDLTKRGAQVTEPSDPLDAQWQAFLVKTYPPPFTPATADYVQE